MNKLLETLRNHLNIDYGAVAAIKYYPPTRGQIESCRLGVVTMRANSNGLHYIVDAGGNAMISQDIHINVPETDRLLVEVLSEWERRTGNVV